MSFCVSADPAAAPSELVTFLFTDVEGSTRRWEADADAMRIALAAHHEVLRSVIEAHSGFMFKHTREGVCAAFASPKPAVDASNLGALPESCSTRPAPCQEGSGCQMRWSPHPQSEIFEWSDHS